MPKVRVSAVRFSSLLVNRNMNTEALAERVTTAVRPHDLLAADQDVEFDDLAKLAKVFGRPWSYLLIDEPEVYPNAAPSLAIALLSRGARRRAIPKLPSGPCPSAPPEWPNSGGCPPVS